MTLETLSAYGMERMSDEAVETYLASKNIGVLGLPAGPSPYLLPMSYGYEGGGRLYFFFIGEEDSRKSERALDAGTASFLVYSVETMFNWRSVLLTGEISRLSDDRRDEASSLTDKAWRPEVFEAASERETTRLFEFRIDEWTGIKHTGLPPEMNPGVDE